MPLVIALSGSPSARSRSAGLLELASRTLAANGIAVREYNLRSFSPDALVNADFDDPQVQRFNADIAQVDGLILSTPIYKAAYSGGTKLLLDLLPERALARAVALPIATGGSSAHVLAIDYAIRPVLAALSARHVVCGVYATDRDLSWTDSGLAISPDVHQRLSRALTQFVAHFGVPENPVLDFAALSQFDDFTSPVAQRHALA